MLPFLSFQFSHIVNECVCYLRVWFQPIFSALAFRVPVLKQKSDWAPPLQSFGDSLSYREKSKRGRQIPWLHCIRQGSVLFTRLQGTSNTLKRSPAAATAGLKQGTTVARDARCKEETWKGEAFQVTVGFCRRDEDPELQDVSWPALWVLS